MMVLGGSGVVSCGGGSMEMEQRLENQLIQTLSSYS